MKDVFCWFILYNQICDSLIYSWDHICDEYRCLVFNLMEQNALYFLLYCCLTTNILNIFAVKQIYLIYLQVTHAWCSKIGLNGFLTAPLTSVACDMPTTKSACVELQTDASLGV